MAEPSLNCWSCNSPNDDWTGIGKTDPGRPDEGSISICFYCGMIGIFTNEGLSTRQPTHLELAEAISQPDIYTAVRAIQLRNSAQ